MGVKGSRDGCWGITDGRVEGVVSKISGLNQVGCCWSKVGCNIWGDFLPVGVNWWKYM